MADPALEKLFVLPDSFLCPITKEPMVNPVCTHDGHTYEQESIEAWLKNHRTSPSTGLPLQDLTLAPNHGLRKAIASFSEIRTKFLRSHGELHRAAVDRERDLSANLEVAEKRVAALEKQNDLLVKQLRSYGVEPATVVSRRLEASDAAFRDALRPLLGLLAESNGSVNCRIEATGVLAHLVRGSAERADEAMAIGAIVPLTKLLGESGLSANGRRAVADALRLVVADSSERRWAAVSEGAVMPLADLLREATETESTDGEARGRFARFEAANLDEREDDEEGGVALSATTALGELFASMDDNQPGTQIQPVITNIIAPLVALLTTGPTSSRVAAAGVVAHMAASSVELVAELASAGAVEALLTLLCTGTRECRAQAVAALRHFCVNSDDRAALIVRRCALPPLVRVMGDGPPLASVHATVTLHHLVFGARERKTSLITEGVLEPLANMLETSSPEGRIAACDVLCSLLYGANKDRAAAVAKATLWHLIRLLQDSTDDVCTHAVLALRNLVGAFGDQVSPVDLITSMLVDIAPDVHHELPDLFPNLASTLTDQTNIVGCLPSALLPLVHRLSASGGPVALAEAAGSLRSFIACGTEASAASVANSGAIGPLASALQTAVASVRSSSKRGSKSSCGSSASIGTEIILDSGDMIRRVEMVAAVNEMIGTLQLLIQGSTERSAALVAVGGLVPICRLLDQDALEPCDHAPLARVRAARTLRALVTASGERAAELASAALGMGVLRSLTLLLDTSASTEESAAAAAALQAIVSGSGQKGSAERALVVAAAPGALHALVSLLGSDCIRCRHEAVGTLCVLAFAAPMLAGNMMQIGVVSYLVKLLSAEAHAGDAASASRTLVARTFRAVAFGVESNEELLSEIVKAALEPLVRILKDGSLDGREEAAGALRLLVAGRPNREAAFVVAGGVEWMVKLLRDGTLWGQTEAATVLASLTGETEERAVLVWSVGALGPLLKVVDADQLNEMFAGKLVNHHPGAAAAARTLHHLVEGSEKRADVAVKAGCYGPLVKQMQKGAIEVRLEAAEILRTLTASAPEPRKAAAAEAGALDGLVGFFDDPELPQSAIDKGYESVVGALRNLSAGPAERKQAVITAGALRTLVQTLANGPTNARVDAAAALRNLAAGSEDRKAAVVSAGALAPLAQLLNEAESDDLRKIAAGTLRNLAASSESRRATVIALGAASALT
eukprot:TRINITY_DN55983_c0_g1_i1.p1 TRINITY_DN55983_c0_g1~~TRINITY_DN55983_c0_g1_i1.p1  ORF type:complete len:1200 (-),score=197.07 TRINITY_DN55983_c0_g1_i1:332-3931(-)